MAISKKFNRANKKTVKANKNMKIKRKVSVKGWSKKAPNTRQRTVMYKKCGKKCFLGKHKSFPICAKHTCKISKQGLEAAYMRARQYKYAKIAKKSQKLMKK